MKIEMLTKPQGSEPVWGVDYAAHECDCCGRLIYTSEFALFDDTLGKHYCEDCYELAIAHKETPDESDVFSELPVEGEEIHAEEKFVIVDGVATWFDSGLMKVIEADYYEPTYDGEDEYAEYIAREVEREIEGEVRWLNNF